MTTTQILVSATIVTAWFALIVLGTLGWVWMSRKTAVARTGKQKSPNTSAHEAAYRSGLILRVWRGAFHGDIRGGFTLLKRTGAAKLHRTLTLDHCIDVPRSLLDFCDEIERRNWLSEEDRQLLPQVRAAMEAASEVFRRARSTGQVNGQTSVDISDALDR